ncbi:hypothetical protein BU24DRAFT_314023, partial [Aaosphaeria arxii CBS 175.79]
FHAHFEYVPVSRMVVCKTHEQGIVRAQFDAHLNNKHKEILPSARRTMATWAVTQHPEWADEESDIVWPAADSAPVPHLPVFHDGFQCLGSTADEMPCTFMRRTIQGIQYHCQHEHDWQNSQRKGRPYRGQVPVGTMWRTGVHCQKFQSRGPLARLFEVCPAEDGQGQMTAEQRAIQEAVGVSMADAKANITALAKKQQDQIEADNDRFEFHRWLNRAQWAVHLEGFDRAWLVSLTRRPERREKALDKVCWAAQMVIWKAQQASQASVVGMPAMNYINRREVGNDTNEKPFNARQTEKTMIRYSERWLEVIRYIWRTHAMSPISPKEMEEG